MSHSLSELPERENATATHQAVEAVLAVASTSRRFECKKDTGGSCAWFGCSKSRGADCVKGKCTCGPNLCQPLRGLRV